jgi:electron transport complex protein RnfG
MRRKLMLITSGKNAKLLSAFAAVCTLFVSLTYIYTKPIIAEQEQRALLNSVTEVLPAKLFNNNPIQNCVSISDELISGTSNPTTVYRATLDGEPSALVFSTETTKGYNGLIKVLVAIDNNGAVQGVRALAHQETPGLGDKIEIKKSDWITSFNEHKVDSEDDSRWFVKKDGGKFDQFTGATITPRAIVNQLRKSVFQAHNQFDAIFALTNHCAETSNAKLEN